MFFKTTIMQGAKKIVSSVAVLTRDLETASKQQEERIRGSDSQTSWLLAIVQMKRGKENLEGKYF